jgi:hypothetical protein
LFIGELLKQVQRFLACCRELRTKRFHTVIAVGKVIFGSPREFTWDAALRAWALKGFGAQPVKISKDLLLRCGKEVLDF